MLLAEKSALLYQTLQDLGSVLIAYSGGTDSAYLAYAAHQTLGDKMLAVIADSPSLPRAELAQALAFTATHNIPTHILQTDELEKPDYIRNDARRCFHCKDTLFAAMESYRATYAFAHLAYGMNLDDQGDFRPGQQAATLHNAVAPLVTAHLTKKEIRLLAQQANLTLWDKPASACLSSRIEYGRPVTRENLSQVEQAEAALHTLGFPQVRVRHHGDLARIEIAREDLPRALSLAVLDQITAALKPLGFLYIALDTQGYRTGSMNAALIPYITPAERIAK
ncbi:ATP-dependent sacrificial sulfur transferase LarE [Granulicella tundricola]|uniref:Queuosine synthesis-like protein n=1 Tax=Granulicella tundricola (strain ATCC BAA-1859 / DSM 23138 / MP5ACTX9) TaxID=1198114 RepID=E8X1U9_GRATM|nr:ATP-dependent sacrificial sulfur transferase LarE [Granulicella tundricola]ADW69110.1 Queuosine synthesis-like protein [Granulicella tundricola MP5ACTX9]